MTLLILLVLLVLALGVASAVRGQGSFTPPPRLIAPASEADEEESPSDLVMRDPVEALLRYGTPQDTARLSEQGADLSALGYRTPDED